MSTEKLGFPSKMIGAATTNCGVATSTKTKKINNNIVWCLSIVVLLTFSMYCLWRVEHLNRQYKVDQLNFKKRILKLEHNEKSSRQLIVTISKSINNVVEQLLRDKLSSTLTPDESELNRVVRKRGKRGKRDISSSSSSSSSPQPRDEENQEKLQRTIHSFRREMFSLNDRYEIIIFFKFFVMIKIDYMLVYMRCFECISAMIKC